MSALTSPVRPPQLRDRHVRFPCGAGQSRRAGETFERICPERDNSHLKHFTTMSYRLCYVVFQLFKSAWQSHGRATYPVRSCDPLHTLASDTRARAAPTCGNRRTVTVDPPRLWTLVHSGRKPSVAPHFGTHPGVLNGRRRPWNTAGPILPVKPSIAARSSTGLVGALSPPVHPNHAQHLSTASPRLLHTRPMLCPGPGGTAYDGVRAHVTPALRRPRSSNLSIARGSGRPVPAHDPPAPANTLRVTACALRTGEYRAFHREA